MTVYCPLCDVYCPDGAAHENGKKHLKNSEKALLGGESIPAMQYGTLSKGEPPAPPVRPQLSHNPPPVKQVPTYAAVSHSAPVPPPGQPANAMFCSLCNVWSGSLVAYNTHIKGKRHAKNEAGKRPAFAAPVQYENETVRQEQEMYKKQYVCLVKDVMCYIRHSRGLVKAEHEYDKMTISKRINEWHPDKLSQEGYGWFDANCQNPGEAKKSEVVFLFEAMKTSVSDIFIGCSVYVSPMSAITVELDNRQATMRGEVSCLWKDRMAIKNITGKGRPWVPAPSYRIDVGATSVPTERMRAVLLMIKRQHLERLRMLGIQEHIDSKDYFSDDEDDTFPIESKVNQMGVFEPFSALAWCVFHNVQQSVNEARKLVHGMFAKYSSSGPIRLATAIPSGMADLGTQPVSSDATVAAKEPHPQYTEFLRPHASPDLPRFSHGLNDSQILAVGKVIDECRKVTLIQGPPGTGKTTTAIAIICEWIRKTKGPILATAHSNAGLDNLMTGLLRRGVRCLRVGKSSNAALEEFSLDAYMQMDVYARDRSILQTKIDELKMRMEQAGATGESMAILGKEYKDVLKQLKTTCSKNSAVRNAIRESDVICATCIGAGSQVLTGVAFPFVLLDEATQATEAASLVPICRGSVQVVLIGDQAQLPPTVMNFEAAKRGLDVSLFDRLLGLGMEHHVLDTQYRMHPQIADFSNHQFYQDRLQNGITPADRQMPTGSLPNDWPLSFTHVVGKEVMQGTSRANIAEAKAVLHILSFVSGKVPWGDIGIITPYSAQVRCIQNEVLRVYGPEVKAAIEVSSVDGFQGREKHIIVLSLVRSNPDTNLGFVSEWRRINVSLTRAKFGLFVTGHIPTLLKSALWFEWLQRHHDRAMAFDIYKQQLTLLDQSMRDLIGAAVRPEMSTYKDMKAFGDTLIPTPPSSAPYGAEDPMDAWAQNGGAGTVYATTAYAAPHLNHYQDVYQQLHAAPTNPAPPMPTFDAAQYAAPPPPPAAAAAAAPDLPYFTPPPVDCAVPNPPTKRQKR